MRIFDLFYLFGGTGGGGIAVLFLVLLLELFVLFTLLEAEEVVEDIPKMDFKVDKNSSYPGCPSKRKGITLAAPALFFNMLIVDAPLEAQNCATFLIVSFEAAGTGVGTGRGTGTITGTDGVDRPLTAAVGTGSVRTATGCAFTPPMLNDPGVTVPIGPTRGDDPMPPRAPWPGPIRLPIGPMPRPKACSGR